MQDTLWILAKGANRSRAISRAVPGVGVELRLVWNDDTRWTQVYHNGIGLAAAASAKREELIAAGWVDAPRTGKMQMRRSFARGSHNTP